MTKNLAKAPAAGEFRLADAHCDTLTVLSPWRLAFGGGGSQLDLPRLAGRAKLQFMACWLGGGAGLAPAAALRRLWQHILDLRYAAALSGGAEILRDLALAGQGGMVQLLPALEGLDYLADDWRRVDQLYAWGFRSFGLFWNNDSFLGCGAAANQTPGRDGGLTAAGRELVRHLAAAGWLVDLAHASERSFWQAAEILADAGRPLFVSHTCCRALCGHWRNLSDEQLRAIGASGGMVGITLAPQFLRADGRAEAADWARHVTHAVELAGAGRVCLGGDWDGVDILPCGIAGVEDAGALYRALLAASFDADAAAGVMGDDLMAFLRRLGENLRQMS